MSQKNEKETHTTPKADPAAAAMHNPFAAFDPMAAWNTAQQTWQKMMTDGFGRAQAWADEYAAFEAQMYARAKAAVDTMAQLAHDTIAYSQQLTQQARKLGVEAARKAGVGA